MKLDTQFSLNLSSSPPNTYESKVEGQPSLLFTLINTKKCFDSFIEESLTQPVIGMDTETNGINYGLNEIIGYSFSWGKDKSFYIPIRHHTFEKQLEPNFVNQGLTRLFSSNVLSIWHNMKFDYKFIKKEGLPFPKKYRDTYLAFRLIDENELAALDEVVLRIFGDSRSKEFYQAIEDARSKIARSLKTTKDNIDYSYIPLHVMTPYSASDSYYALAIYLAIKQEFYKFLNMGLYTQEGKLAPILADAEMEGIDVDDEYVRQLEIDVTGELRTAEKTIFDIAGKPFNINSNEELTNVCENLGIKSYKKTKTGIQSWDERVIKSYANKYPIFKEIQTWKKSNSFLTKDIQKIKDHSINGKIYCDIKQSDTVTGRMSCAEPNLQNTDNSPRIRRAFICPKQPNAVMVYADFSQIELRILAQMTQDPTMIDTFLKGQDIHSRSASEMFNIPMERFDKSRMTEEDNETRRISKTINFGVVYGQSKYGLSESLNKPVEECDGFIKRFFERYPSIFNLKEDTKIFLMKNGYVQTMFGRKRHFPDLLKLEKKEKEEMFRAAFNTTIQGTAADMLKRATIRCNDMLKKGKLQTRMLLWIHDEIWFKSIDEELDVVLPIIKMEMEADKILFDIPIEVEISTSKTNWAEKKKVDIKKRRFCEV